MIELRRRSYRFMSIQVLMEATRNRTEQIERVMMATSCRLWRPDGTRCQGERNPLFMSLQFLLLSPTRIPEPLTQFMSYLLLRLHARPCGVLPSQAVASNPVVSPTLNPRSRSRRIGRGSPLAFSGFVG